ncbi:zinc finger B-box domain-containing protein 1 [Pipistrellus kuhlii]|uniref:zinc finger B-box domain-containing protein 1 n=1 Tax=Pipistrellus kuhlii TaxID=59472 RepID=UPI001E273D7E|nr:zinc finger B-box domain-containing protein 1 [Pipistrellus kuhlii]
MNSKDFVVLPWGKPGHSVKLKYKNARELKIEKVQLELENQEVEKKLQEFQSTRNKDKEERESSDYHWKSGKVGKLGNPSHILSQNKGNVIKPFPGKVRLKLLKEKLQEPVKQGFNYQMANFSEREKPKMRGKVCGQCENKTALLVCLECGEDYCSGCFAKIHQKGALKFHRTTLLQTKTQILSNVLDVAHRFIKEVSPDKLKGENRSPKEISKRQHRPKPPPLQGSSCQVEVSTTPKEESTNPRDRLLCEGSFDEEASAQSFQEVLNEWRTGRHSGKEEQNVPAAKPVEECEVQTNLKIWREPLHVEFKEDSISYMDKLWLKKHRRTPQEQLQNKLPDKFIPQCTTTSEAPCSQNESDEDNDVEETKVQCPALFLPVEELRTERPESSLRIVELDDTYEEECEEQGKIVPYKVELADAVSQQSCTFYDYQNTFLYKNYIHQHHVFTKEKTDLLHLHPSNSPSYCEDNSKGTSNKKVDSNVDPDVYSLAVENLGESSFSESHFKEKSIIDMECNQMLNNSCISSANKDSFPKVDLETPSIKEKLSQDSKESLECSNFLEKPNFEDSKTTESPLSLQEIALRNKPITEKYQGLERFFVSERNESLNSLPSHSLERRSSGTTITIAGDRDWIPDQSIIACPNSAVASGAVQCGQNPSSGRTQQKMGKTPQRPSTANLPLSTSVKRSSNRNSSYPPPRSAPAQLLSRAASEISEIEHIDITDHNEPFSDNTADQQTFDSLEKELNMLRSLADLSDKHCSQTSEESPAFSNDPLNLSLATLDSFQTSHPRGLCGIKDLSFSENDTEIQSFLTLSESSMDEEEKDFLDKEYVIILPWQKST